MYKKLLTYIKRIKEINLLCGRIDRMIFTFRFLDSRVGTTAVTMVSLLTLAAFNKFVRFGWDVFACA